MNTPQRKISAPEKSKVKVKFQSLGSMECALPSCLDKMPPAIGVPSNAPKEPRIRAARPWLHLGLVSTVMDAMAVNRSTS